MFDWLHSHAESIEITANLFSIFQFFSPILLIFVGLLIRYLWKNQKIARNQVVVNTSLICRWFSDCFLKAYLQHIVYEHRVFNIKGLRTRGQYSVELEHVFVELRIAPSSNPNQPQHPLLRVEEKELQGNQPIWEFLRYGRKRPEQLLLAIIGAPGCGKTTLLQHVALQFATKAPSGLPKWIPILLFLRQHVTTILSERPTLADLAQQHFSNSKRYPNLQPPAQWFQRQLNAGNCLILLDGLDEVANAEERKQISTWIDEQSVHYPLCPLIVTSRPQGYHAAPLSRATMLLEVQAFSSSQVKQFINAWYLATEIMSFGGKDDAGVRLRATQEAEDLQLRLQKRPALEALTVNPLLLTMIAMVHRYRGQLPGRRVELYAEICDVLLGHWREAKGIQDSLTAAQKRVALQPLAAWMMEHEVREIEMTQALEVIREPLQMLGMKDGEEFLKDIQASSGLFSEREMNVWSFAHLTFQEYLAAAHYKDQKIHGNWWHRKVADSWWHETLLLYAAQADATPIVKSCLNSKTLATLSLAADCLDEALQLDAAVRQQVETVLIENLESDDPELFKLAAEVKLQRRLKNLQRIDDTREIDRTFISCAEYQLFLDEMRDQGKFYQPDHWTSYRFHKGLANSPITGVRANDAQAFCDWLSYREDLTYRLPKQKEITEDSTINFPKLIAVWCQESEGNHELRFISPKCKQDIPEKINSLLSREAQSVLPLIKVFDYTKCRIRERENRLASRGDYILSEAVYTAFARALDMSRSLGRTDIQINKHKKSLGKVDFLPLLDSCIAADTPLEKRKAWRLYALVLARTYYETDRMPTKASLLKNVSKYIPFLPNPTISIPMDQQMILETYWWLKITMLREEGELPAWEGIRIVRESDV